MSQASGRSSLAWATSSASARAGGLGVDAWGTCSVSNGYIRARGRYVTAGVTRWQCSFPCPPRILNVSSAAEYGYGAGAYRLRRPGPHPDDRRAPRVLSGSRPRRRQRRITHPPPRLDRHLFVVVPASLPGAGPPLLHRRARPAGLRTDADAPRTALDRPLHELRPQAGGRAGNRPFSPGRSVRWRDGGAELRAPLPGAGAQAGRAGASLPVE